VKAIHEWRETDPGQGQRIIRAWREGKRWIIRIRLKDEEDWSDPNPTPISILQTLRKRLWDKYQRRRVPWEHVDEIDKILEKRGADPVDP